MKRNKLLSRQLKRFFPAEGEQSPAFAEFLNAVNDSYNSYERDIELYNHVIKVNEEEYGEINQQLSDEIDFKRKSVSKLKKSILDIGLLENKVGQSENDELYEIVTCLEAQVLKRREAEEIYTSLIMNLQSGILLEDENRKIVLVNQLFCRMFEIPVPVEMMIGVDCSQSAEQSKHLFKDPVSFVSKIEQILEEKKMVIGDIIETMDGRILERDYIPIFIGGKYNGHLWKYNNITQKRESERKVAESEFRFRVGLEKLGDNVWEHDFRTGKTYFSRADFNFLGYGEGEVSNSAALWTKSVHPQDLGQLVERDSQYVEGKIDHHSIEYRLTHQDGSFIWMLDRGVVIEKDPHGFPLKIIGTHTDITKLKEIEQALADREKLFRSLSEYVPGVLYQYYFKRDGRHGFKYISPAIEKYLGISQQQAYALELYVHPEDLPELRRLNQISNLTNEPFNFEGRLLIPGRGEIWHSVSSSFSYQQSDGTKVFTGIIVDITERKDVENAIKIREEKYRSIITNMHLGLLEVDKDEIITFANQSFCDMSGFDLKELEGKKASTLFVRGKNAKLIESKNELRQKGYSDAYEIELNNKKGEVRWWLISGAPHYNDRGELIGSIGIHLDITKQKELELELRDAKIMAEGSALAKENFLANMSHEIRTPMNAILGMSRQLSKTKLDEKQHFYLGTIQSASENLLVIINDILDLSKIEAGKLSFEKIGFNVSEVITRATSVIHLKAEEKGLKISCLMDPRVSPVLLGDPYRLNQILLNLLSNSVKFTESGMVSIVCQLERKEGDRQLVTVSVKDTGIGMDESFLKAVFDKFVQEEASGARKFGGTGLGMSISKQLVELMEGEISIDSKKGMGTEVRFTIPFLVGSESDLPVKTEIKADTTLLAGKRILLVEDNEMNRLVASTVLNNYGLKIDEALNGHEAIEALKLRPYDLVLMDVQMPLMDGLEATRLIREKLSGSIPIIALTANAIKGESDKCIAAGMNDYISKPFVEEDLIKMIATWLGKEQAEVPAREESQREPTLFSLQGLTEISRGNVVFVNKMISLFVTQVPAAVAEIKTANSQLDFRAVKSSTHRIKPSIQGLRIESLRKVLPEIEALAGANIPSPKLDSLIDFMAETIDRVVIQLEQHN